MILSRERALKIHYFLDQCLPPILRDAHWFMKWPMKLFYGLFAEEFMQFKERAPFMGSQEMVEFYTRIASAPPRRVTNLTDQSVAKILISLIGTHILEVGAGSGYLAKRMRRYGHVTAVDVHILSEAFADAPEIATVQASVEALPFPDRSFESVVCTHTLEHIPNLSRAIAELRRVTRTRLIIVVPCQRPYRYTFDPHVHFFPYEFSLHVAFGKPWGKTTCELIGGDWMYMEDTTTS